MSEAKWYLRTQDETFGPESEAKLVEWAKLGRIQPGQEISDDEVVWRKVEDVPFLDMRFSIDIGDGNPRGPFNKAAAEALLASGRLPPISTLVEVREPFESESEEPLEADVPTEEPAADGAAAEPRLEVREVRIEVPVEKIVEKTVEVPVEKIVEKIVEVPVERIVEKTVEVPVEKIVEKVVEIEKTIEVPVEKIVEVDKIVEVEKVVETEVEKIVVDDRRVRELEALLADSQARTSKLSEQVVSLESELSLVPQAASEVADTKAAVYSLMRTEEEEIAKLIDIEKREADDFRKRHQERIDRLIERRRELLKRAGANVEDMVRRALIARPEDPRTARLREELEELRRTSERRALDAEQKIRDLTDKLRIKEAEQSRAVEGMKDVTELHRENQMLRERLQLTEKDLLAERQRNEELSRQQAANQQTLLKRLAALESPSIGTTASISTNQSREAKMVKLPSWMRLGK